jgi:hypothetical protein
VLRVTVTLIAISAALLLPPAAMPQAAEEPLSVHWVTTEIDPDARLCEVHGKLPSSRLRSSPWRRSIRR